MTVVELDLVQSSLITEAFEQSFGIGGSRWLGEQVKDFVGKGMRAARVRAEKSLVCDTGDGAMLIFETPPQAHRFAEAVHEASRRHNVGKTEWTAIRLFRIGAATGNLLLSRLLNGNLSIDGTPAMRSVRLEASASPGSFVVDEATYRGLTAAQKMRYTGRISIRAKHNSKFITRQCPMNLEAPSAAATLSLRLQLNNAHQHITDQLGK